MTWVVPSTNCCSYSLFMMFVVATFGICLSYQLLFNFIGIHRGSEAVAVEIPQGESLEVTVFTRSTSGAAFSILDPKSKKNILEGVEVKHNGTSETEMPTSVILNKEMRIHGPRTCKVRVNGHGSRLSVHNYLVVFSFYKDAH